MPLINSYKISPHSFFGIWKIEESTQEMRKINKSEKINFNETKNDKKFKESVACRIIIKHLCPLLNLKYYGINKKNSGKPFLLKNNAFISFSHSYPYAVALINKKESCGIDIEKIREKILKLNHKFLNKYETIKVGNSLKENTIYWSCKEALFKADRRQKISFINEILIDKIEEKDKMRGKLKNKNFILSIKKIEDYIIVYTN